MRCRRNASIARWLREAKNAHFVFPVLDNQPTLFDRLDALDWATSRSPRGLWTTTGAATNYAPSRFCPPARSELSRTSPRCS